MIVNVKQYVMHSINLCSIFRHVIDQKVNKQNIYTSTFNSEKLQNEILSSELIIKLIITCATFNDIQVYDIMIKTLV